MKPGEEYGRGESGAAVPVDQWTGVKDEQVLIFVVHDNAQYATDAKELARWQSWCVGAWTDFNKGGWVWHGLMGRITHVARLPENPPAALPLSNPGRK